MPINIEQIQFRLWHQAPRQYQNCLITDVIGCIQKHILQNMCLHLIYEDRLFGLSENMISQINFYHLSLSHQYIMGTKTSGTLTSQYLRIICNLQG